jgi:hypothetical protein
MHEALIDSAKLMPYQSPIKLMISKATCLEHNASESHDHVSFLLFPSASSELRSRVLLTTIYHDVSIDCPRASIRLEESLIISNENSHFSPFDKAGADMTEFSAPQALRPSKLSVSSIRTSQGPDGIASTLDPSKSKSLIDSSSSWLLQTLGQIPDYFAPIVTCFIVSNIALASSILGRTALLHASLLLEPSLPNSNCGMSFVTIIACL